MSKTVKEMEMQAMRREFHDVRDLVLLNIVGLDSISDNQMRLDLRKKGIRLAMVKNALARRVFSEMGLEISDKWDGPTTVAWGGSSVADLSKELEALVKKHDKKVNVKTAVADGGEVTFKQALDMPTREQALGRIVMLALAPASRLVGQILGPASQVAGQIKSLKDREDDAAPADASADAPAEAASGDAAPADAAPAGGAEASAESPSA